MCLAPVQIDSSNVVACRKCRVCRDNRKWDYVGRAWAEAQLATKTVAVTMTYRGNVVGAVVPQYRDWQLFLKGLRNDGYKVRYMVAGEFGSLRGRMHWHAILFFYGKVPVMQLDTERWDWAYWPHGFTYVQNPDHAKGIAYVAKYALKDENSQGSAKSLMVSKKPPLGEAFFVERARLLVARRMPMATAKYTLGAVRKRDGAPRELMLAGRVLHVYVAEYFAEAARIGFKPPRSQFLNDYCRKALKDRQRAVFEEWLWEYEGPPMDEAVARRMAAYKPYGRCDAGHVASVCPVVGFKALQAGRFAVASFEDWENQWFVSVMAHKVDGKFVLSEFGSREDYRLVRPVLSFSWFRDGWNTVELDADADLRSGGVPPDIVERFLQKRVLVVRFVTPRMGASFTEYSFTATCGGDVTFRRYVDPKTREITDAELQAMIERLNGQAQ